MTLHGGADSDTFFFDPSDPVASPNWTPVSPNQTAGTLTVTGHGTVTYGHGRDRDDRARADHHLPSSFTVTQGQSLTLSSTVVPLGTATR